MQAIRVMKSRHNSPLHYGTEDKNAESLHPKYPRVQWVQAEEKRKAGQDSAYKLLFNNMP